MAVFQSAYACSSPQSLVSPLNSWESKLNSNHKRKFWDKSEVKFPDCALVTHFFGGFVSWNSCDAVVFREADRQLATFYSGKTRSAGMSAPKNSDRRYWSLWAWGAFWSASETWSTSTFKTQIPILVLLVSILIIFFHSSVGNDIFPLLVQTVSLKWRKLILSPTYIYRTKSDLLVFGFCAQ